ncbi:MAG TPA: hypothetical protein VFD88_03845 [Clostridia bacterium]|nr:hypothetical protein [Clostridia bacterium]
MSASNYGLNDDAQPAAGALQTPRHFSAELAPVLEIDPGDTSAGDFPSPVNDRLALTGAGHHRVEWEIDPETMVARALSFEVEIRPFLGVIGMPPSITGIHSTVPLRPTGDEPPQFSGTVRYSSY